MSRFSWANGSRNFDVEWELLDHESMDIVSEHPRGELLDRRRRRRLHRGAAVSASVLPYLPVVARSEKQSSHMRVSLAAVHAMASRTSREEAGSLTVRSQPPARLFISTVSDLHSPVIECTRGRSGAEVRLLAAHQGEPGSPLNFRVWESCRTMPLLVGFSRDLPLPLHSNAAPYLTSPSAVDVKSRPNLSTSLSPFRISIDEFGKTYKCTPEKNVLHRRLKVVHDKLSTFEINHRKKSLPLPAYILTGAMSDVRPVKLVTMEGFRIITSSKKVSLERRTNKVLMSMTMSISHKAEEHTTCIQVDLKQGFQKSSFYGEKAYNNVEARRKERAGGMCAAVARLPRCGRNADGVFFSTLWHRRVGTARRPLTRRAPYGPAGKKERNLRRLRAPGRITLATIRTCCKQNIAAACGYTTRARTPYTARRPQLARITRFYYGNLNTVLRSDDVLERQKWCGSRLDRTRVLRVIDGPQNEVLCRTIVIQRTTTYDNGVAKNQDVCMSAARPWTLREYECPDNAASRRGSPPAPRTNATPTQIHVRNVVIHPIAQDLSFILVLSYEVIVSDSNILQTFRRHLCPGIPFVVVRLFTSHQGKPGSIPGGAASEFSHVGIVPDDAIGPRVFSGIACFPGPFIPVLFHAHLSSPSVLSGAHCYGQHPEKIDPTEVTVLVGQADRTKVSGGQTRRGKLLSVHPDRSGGLDTVNPYPNIAVLEVSGPHSCRRNTASQTHSHREVPEPIPADSANLIAFPLRKVPPHRNDGQRMTKSHYTGSLGNPTISVTTLLYPHCFMGEARLGLTIISYQNHSPMAYWEHYFDSLTIQRWILQTLYGQSASSVLEGTKPSWNAFAATAHSVGVRYRSDAAATCALIHISQALVERICGNCTLSGRAVPQRRRSYVFTDTYKPSPRGTHLRQLHTQWACAKPSWNIFTSPQQSARVHKALGHSVEWEGDNVVDHRVKSRTQVFVTAFAENVESGGRIGGVECNVSIFTGLQLRCGYGSLECSPGGLGAARGKMNEAADRTYQDGGRIPDPISDHVVREATYSETVLIQNTVRISAHKCGALSPWCNSAGLVQLSLHKAEEHPEGRTLAGLQKRLRNREWTIQLEQSVELSDRVQPATLLRGVTSEQPASGPGDCEVVGWWFWRRGGGGATVHGRLAASSPAYTLPYRRCRSSYFGVVEHDTQFCVVVPHNQSALGYNGNPVICDGRLIGIRLPHISYPLLQTMEKKNCTSPLLPYHQLSKCFILPKDYSR
ncbi:hypothetical protein PR048_004967 [Dryococelus australis]|uniref:Uncharacterized protein n=1 Tax=Dryococelus australis TaxID=614101 RepID=A0ABQ9I7D0_9NEOP|nr:hypothetical protein PR048_004967 [Dryococelus australis]